ncbi:hypothetical protein KFL_003580140 [Klebsormidium nitens]|uniref:Uncharacterized protein n=1 Tax=Klebsormidium nitens TaxID=105231 RepID=A0A1Y1IEL1_KLENI|nr:hypothetical protein KFL_003580140 [Klebsormidium nitens]|eukprot:GAQ87521.1 hypothetical protein KFL_003580140 [Klebsormidium nitens]
MAGAGLASKWGLLVACMWIQSCGGNSYNFAIYSAAIKDKLRYDQTRLDTLAVAKDVGGNVGILSGVLCDVLPAWALLLIGATQNLAGYLGLWLAVTAKIPEPPLWGTSILICLGTNGATFFNTAVLVTCLRTFPHNRGMVLGLLKGFIGLSGAIFTQLYLVLYSPDQVSFLLLIAVLPAVVAVLLSPLVREQPPAGDEDSEPAQETSTLLALYGASLLLAALLLAAMLARELLPGSMRLSAGLTAGILGLLFAPALVSLRAWLRRQEANEPEAQNLLEDGTGHTAAGQRNTEGVHAQLMPGPWDSRSVVETNDRRGGLRSTEPHAAARSTEAESAEGGAQVRESTRPARGSDHTLGQAVQGADFWLLCTSQIIGAGCGLTAINNLAQVGAALGQARSVGVLVGLVNVWSFLGRIAGGAVSEYYVRERGAPRPLFLLFVQAAMAAGHLSFAAAVPGGLHVGSVLAGVTYGGQWALMAATASELFGLAHFGTLYNVLAMGSPASTYLLSARLAGWIYDKEARRQRRAAWPAESSGSCTLSRKLVSTATTPFMLAVEGKPDESWGLHGGRPKRQARASRAGAWASAVAAEPGSRGGRAPALRPDCPPTCSGAHCFRLTFLILAGVCALGSVVNGWLALRTRSFYRERRQEGLRKEETRQRHLNAG